MPLQNDMIMIPVYLLYEWNIDSYDGSVVGFDDADDADDDYLKYM